MPFCLLAGDIVKHVRQGHAKDEVDGKPVKELFTILETTRKKYDAKKQNLQRRMQQHTTAESSTAATTYGRGGSPSVPAQRVGLDAQQPLPYSLPPYAPGSSQSARTQSRSRTPTTPRPGSGRDSPAHTPSGLSQSSQMIEAPNNPRGRPAVQAARTSSTPPRTTSAQRKPPSVSPNSTSRRPA